MYKITDNNYITFDVETKIGTMHYVMGDGEGASAMGEFHFHRVNYKAEVRIRVKVDNGNRLSELWIRRTDYVDRWSNPFCDAFKAAATEGLDNFIKNNPKVCRHADFLAKKREMCRLAAKKAELLKELEDISVNLSKMDDALEAEQGEFSSVVQ